MRKLVFFVGVFLLFLVVAFGPILVFPGNGFFLVRAIINIFGGFFLGRYAAKYYLARWG